MQLRAASSGSWRQVPSTPVELLKLREHTVREKRMSERNGTASNTADITSAELQWLGLCRNIGTWEGNQASYDADGSLQKRQPTVLFIRTDSADDAAKVSRGESPLVVKMRLHRTRDGTEGNQMAMAGMDFMGRGVAYDPETGAMTSGSATIGAGPVVELGLNMRDSSHGPVRGRTRMVGFFTAEHLQRLVIFRERRSSIDWKEAKPTVPDKVASADFVASGFEASPRALEGRWRVDTTVVDVSGGAGQATGKFEAHTVQRRVLGDGRRVEIVDDDVVVAVGEISPDGKVMVVSGEGIDLRRVLFLGGGVTVTTSVAVGTGELYVKLGWLVQPGVRLTVLRRYVGGRWVKAEFSRELRERE